MRAFGKQKRGAQQSFAPPEQVTPSAVAAPVVLAAPHPPAQPSFFGVPLPLTVQQPLAEGFAWDPPAAESCGGSDGFHARRGVALTTRSSDTTPSLSVPTHVGQSSCTATSRPLPEIGCGIRHSENVLTPVLPVEEHESSTQDRRCDVSIPNGIGPRHVRLVFEAAAGYEYIVCPFLSFRIESAFTISVGRVQSVANGGDSEVIEVCGQWRRHLVGVVHSAEMPVRIVLSAVGHSGCVRVVDAHGPGRFRRCASEHWELANVGSVSFAAPGGMTRPSADWASQLRLGATVVIQRPRRRALMLRKPEQQTSRLLVQLARKNGSCLLAAPTGSGAAVAVLAAVPQNSAVAVGSLHPLLVPQVVRDELEDRFGVVLADGAHAAELMPPPKVAEATLRRLLAAGAVACLRSKGWASVEDPCRLIPSSYLFDTKGPKGDAAGGFDGRKPLPAAARVPCVDIACLRVLAETSCRLVADIDIAPTVRRAQPLVMHLSRGLRTPELLGPFAQNQSGNLSSRPRVRVLPQMTEAEVVQIYPSRLPQTSQLPEDLRSVEDFSSYWRLVHGYELEPAKLFSDGFASVSFPRADFGPLTYPLACLWRQAWVEQPMMTQKLAPKIFAMAFDCLIKVNLLGGRQRACGLAETSGPSRALQGESVVLPRGSSAPPPRFLPASRAVPSACGGQARATVPTTTPPRPRMSTAGGKRRLLLPLLTQPCVDVTHPMSPAKRARYVGGRGVR
eukprot:TRINITY_DN74340_c0_g1_i1.p1 TRINITY_DN74340_c0_g1~~TRINITY_DN74340_c0_g1_i1.p1  ORF type:complete len:732 (-),score=87.85 TRINITY_DN74340_c0_g1_i1:43-2238(-)